MRFRVVVFFLLLASLAAAQVQRGSITGTVFDSQGAVVPNAQITTTDNSTGTIFTVKNGRGVPHALFGTGVISDNNPNVFHYAASPDGKSFLLGKTGEEAGQQLNLVVNWLAELKK